MHFAHPKQTPAQVRAAVCRTYAAHLKTNTICVKSGELIWSVAASDGFEVDPAHLVETVADLENLATTALKQSDINLTATATVEGEEVLIKRCRLPRRGQRLRYRFRASRARRAWAAAHTLQQFGFATPTPYAFVECCRGQTPLQSAYVHEHLPRAITARRWIKPHLHRATPVQRDEVRRELSEALLRLYDHGLYHGDTKAGNLLLTFRDEQKERTWHWIDLECMQIGVRATRRRVLRNLVQLNGSIGSKIEDADRLAFLDDLAPRFPWLQDPRVADIIRHRTMQRLRRELSGECGH